MAIKIEHIMPYSPATIWAIVGQPGRVDWVPGVESIELEGNKRVFKMSGMGRLVEEILNCDDENMELSYSAIETMAPIKHHFAKIKLIPGENRTTFEWTTQIDPPEFADAIRQGMLASLDQLEEVLNKS